VYREVRASLETPGLGTSLACIAHKPWKKEQSLFCLILTLFIPSRFLSGSIARNPASALARGIFALAVLRSSIDIAQQRFLREARAAAALQHQNVASIFNLGTNLGEYFYVMEFIDGETLDAYVRRKGPLELTEALNISIQVSRALDAAAQQHLTRNSAHRPGTTWKHTSSRSSAAPAYRVGASRTQGKSHRFFAIGT